MSDPAWLNSGRRFALVILDDKTFPEASLKMRSISPGQRCSETIARSQGHADHQRSAGTDFVMQSLHRSCRPSQELLPHADSGTYK